MVHVITVKVPQDPGSLEQSYFGKEVGSSEVGTVDGGSTSWDWDWSPGSTRGDSSPVKFYDGEQVWVSNMQWFSLLFGSLTLTSTTYLYLSD